MFKKKRINFKLIVSMPINYILWCAYRARLWPIEPVAKICSGRKTRGTQFDSGRWEFNSPFYQIQVGVKLLLDFRYVGESDGVKNK